MPQPFVHEDFGVENAHPNCLFEEVERDDVVESGELIRDRVDCERDRVSGDVVKIIKRVVAPCGNVFDDESTYFLLN